MAILEIKNLSKVYGNEEIKTIAANDIHLSIEKGEFVAIVGKSGSGKSTLLHMIGGIDRPTSGNIYINGIDIYSLSEPKQAEFRRREVAIIYQFYNLIPVLNVEENIMLPVKLDNRRVDIKKMDEIIKKLDLQNRRKNFPNELSRRTTAKSCNW